MPAACLIAALVVAVPAVAIDLSSVTVEQLENGLTVLVLEEHALPIASVQMLYRVGSRDEGPGHTGLAHFLEHMAFRASERFPINDVVRRIYAVGGEWHGYTWIDQTTYFATVPREHLDLLLAIEADRMTSLLLAEDEVEAERGAVMAELRGYEEDPETVLTETVPTVVFLQHPYRYNTIGWPSDVQAIRHEEIVAFYGDHYRPANAVLAIVGDIDTANVLKRVHELFAAIPGGGPPLLPPTVEPPQHGERRVTLEGETDAALFEIAWQAPAVTSPDWPVFLLLQEILGGSGGVNFHQAGFGVAVRPGSRLDGLADSTWLSPTAMPYVFTISGSIPTDGSPTDIESTIESVLESLRTEGISTAEITQAQARLREELVFDVETTEDAAHQLAFYAGLGALDVLLTLDERLGSVTRDQVNDVARRYLTPSQRTVGWFVPAAAASGERHVEQVAQPPGDARPPAIPATGARSGSADARTDPLVRRLTNGLPVVVQAIGLSPTAHLRVLVDGTGVIAHAETTTDTLLWDRTSLGWRMLTDGIEDGVAAAREALADLQREPPAPRSAFQLALEGAAGLARLESTTTPTPLTAVFVGDLDLETALDLLERTLGDLPLARPRTLPTASASPERPVRIPIERLPARTSGRARLGYAVRAPAPSNPDWAAWRALLYVLTHDYEGRLGHAAIHERGLAYYIDSDYSSDGHQAWVSFRVSAEPTKLEELTDLVVTTLAELERRPPSADEVAEARQHLLGRRVSAAQSNAEISARLASDLLWLGRPQTVKDFAARLGTVTESDLERILPAFLAGRLIVEPVEVR